MITCYLRYIIDPYKLQEFERYGKMWIPLVEKFGGTHHGYFLPSKAPTMLRWPCSRFQAWRSMKTTAPNQCKTRSALPRSSTQTEHAASLATSAVSSGLFSADCPRRFLLGGYSPTSMVGAVPQPRIRESYGSDASSGGFYWWCAGRPVERLLHRPRRLAGHSGAVRRSATRHQRGPWLEYQGLDQHHHQRVEDCGPKKATRTVAVSRRRGHRLFASNRAVTNGVLTTSTRSRSLPVAAWLIP